MSTYRKWRTNFIYLAICQIFKHKKTQESVDELMYAVENEAYRKAQKALDTYRKQWVAFPGVTIHIDKLHDEINKLINK